MPQLRRAPCTRLENPAKNDVQMLAILTPEAGIHAKHDTLVGVEAEPEAVVAFQILEIQIGAAVADFPRIVEERAVEAAPDLPAILHLSQNRVRSPESVLSKSAQRIVPTECRHEVERHDVSRISVGRRHEKPRRNDPSPGEE